MSETGSLNEEDPVLGQLANELQEQYPTALSLPEDLDSRIAGFPPNLAIEWGYNLYLADSLPRDSETRKSAATAVEELEGFVETFPVGSRERVYLSACRVAATGFARGIDRRKKSHAEGLAIAKERKDRKISGVAYGIPVSAFLSAGFRAILLGTIMYALVQAIFEIPALSAHNNNVDRSYAALATGLGIALISAWWSNYWTVRIIDAYDEERDKVDGAYSDQVVMEYRLAAETAVNAWHQLTGQKATVTKAFENLLLGLMRGAHKETSKKK